MLTVRFAGDGWEIIVGGRFTVKTAGETGAVTEPKELLTRTV